MCEQKIHVCLSMLEQCSPSGPLTISLWIRRSQIVTSDYHGEVYSLSWLGDKSTEDIPSKPGPDFHPPGPQSVETLGSEIRPS